MALAALLGERATGHLKWLLFALRGRRHNRTASSRGGGGCGESVALARPSSDKCARRPDVDPAQGGAK